MKSVLIVIGGGPGGYVAAIRAAQLGLRTVLVERAALGGACLNRGCIPTKTLLHSASLYRQVLHSAAFGVTASDAGFDYAVMDERRRQVVEQLRRGVEGLLKGNGVEVIHGSAVIQGPGRVRVGEAIYESEHILVAVGARPALPPIPGLDLPGVVTSDGLLGEGMYHPRLTIIGGGVIGMEFASFFNSMGVKVSVVEMMPEILGAMDKETAGMLRSEYLKRGVNFYLGTKVTAVSHEGVTVEKDGKASLIEAGKILVSVGRKANLGQAGLDKLNVELLRNGVKVDEHMQTSHPRVYACGDITGRSMLAHTAIRESEVAVNHILGVEDAMNYDCIPGVVYTNPEVAGVGKTEEELKALGTGYHIQKLPMAYSGRFVAENELGNGLCKLVLDDGDRIIGCHLLGNPASEIIVAAGIAVQHGYTVEEFQKSVFPHPTVGEIFHETLFA